MSDVSNFLQLVVLMIESHDEYPNLLRPIIYLDKSKFLPAHLKRVMTPSSAPNPEPSEDDSKNDGNGCVIS